MEEGPYIIRKRWNIDLLVGKGFTPLTGIRTEYLSFTARKNDSSVNLLLDLSENESDEYKEFLDNKEGFKYLSIFDMDGMITKDLLTFVKTITDLELKDIEFNIDIMLNKDGETISEAADIIYQNELFLCKKGVKPSVLKD